MIQIIPNGITDSICGATARDPFLKISDLESIYLIFFKAFLRYFLSKLQSL